MKLILQIHRKTPIIVDEMGLGKTIQAIGTVILKKHIFKFAKTCGLSGLAERTMDEESGKVPGSKIVQEDVPAAKKKIPSFCFQE